jgi:TRAP-type C4-dicarboxylate transport system permease small subunit
MPARPLGENRSMDALDKLNQLLNKWLLVAGGVAVLALMALATGNVLMRILGVPFRGAYELVSFLGAVVTAFALGYTQKRKFNIVVDILSDRFPESVKRLLDGIGYLIGLLFFAVVAWVLVQWGLKIAASGEVSETLKIVYYPFVFCVALGFAMLSLTLAIDVIGAFRKKGGH